MNQAIVSRWWVLLIPLVLACTPGGGDDAHRQPPPVRVQVVTASARTLPETLSSVGSLASPDMTTVSSEISGRVVALDVPEGQRVEEGHVLARLDDAEARAAVTVARARRTNTRDRLRRLERLRANSVSSEQAYEDAKAEHEGAIGAFDEAQTRLERTTIAAPFAGVLGLRQVNLGQIVASGTPIVELTQVDPLQLVFSIPQRFAGQLAVRQDVQGRVGSCGARFDGVVQAIDPRVDPATRSVRLQATVPNPDGSLYPGMAVSLRLVVGEIPGAVVIPQESIVRFGTKHIVYVLDADGLAEQRNVELGRFFADGVHVLSGVDEGETVVVSGHQKLQPGAKTAAEPFEPVENPNLALGQDGPCEPDL